MLSRRVLSLIAIVIALFATAALCDAATASPAAVEAVAQRVSRRDSLRERAAVAYQRRNERKYVKLQCIL